MKRRTANDDGMLVDDGHHTVVSNECDHFPCRRRTVCEVCLDTIDLCVQALAQCLSLKLTT